VCSSWLPPANKHGRAWAGWSSIAGGAQRDGELVILFYISGIWIVIFVVKPTECCKWKKLICTSLMHGTCIIGVFFVQTEL
jgi:hypothetical protein